MSQELPHAPNMEHLRKQAKDLIHLYQAHAPEAVALLQSAHPAFAGLTPEQVFRHDLHLAEAQLAVARQHGFTSWAQMKAFIELRPQRVEGGIVISDTPGLTLEEALNERARRQGMPPIGSRMTNQYGLHWQIVDYDFVRTTPSLTRTVREDPRRDPCDFLPVVVPQNLSSRLADFFHEIDHCTSKFLVMVDTMPETHPLRAGKNIHYVNGFSDPERIVLHLDVARLHESVLAHELAHLWVTFVEGSEDSRFLCDRSDAGKVNQFDFIQSFVLDLRVNDLIEERGFDMAPINQDQFEGLAATAEVLLRGYRPPSKREAAVHAPLLAGAILEQKRWPQGMRQRLPAILAVYEACLPEVYTLAGQFVESVRLHGYTSQEGIRRSIDECTILSFRATGDAFDLEQDLQTAPLAECMQDKYPEENAGLPVPLKLEIARVEARHRISQGAVFYLEVSPSGKASVAFEETSGRRVGPIELKISLSLFFLPTPSRSRPTVENSVAIPGQSFPSFPIDQKARLHHPPFASNPTGFPPSREIHLPQPDVPKPGVPRRYMAGVGKWLGRARLAQRLGMRTNLYQYTFNNPVSYFDPSGLQPFPVGSLSGNCLQLDQPAQDICISCKGLNPLSNTVGNLSCANCCNALNNSLGGLINLIAGYIGPVPNIIPSANSANCQFQCESECGKMPSGSLAIANYLQCALGNLEQSIAEGIVVAILRGLNEIVPSPIGKAPSCQPSSPPAVQPPPSPPVAQPPPSPPTAQPLLL